MSFFFFVNPKGSDSVAPVVVGQGGFADGPDTDTPYEITPGEVTEWRFPKVEPFQTKSKPAFLKRVYEPPPPKPQAPPRPPAPNLYVKPPPAKPEPLQVKFTHRETFEEKVQRWEHVTSKAVKVVKAIEQITPPEPPPEPLELLVPPAVFTPRMSEGYYPEALMRQELESAREDQRVENILSRASDAQSDEEMALALSEL